MRDFPFQVRPHEVSLVTEVETEANGLDGNHKFTLIAINRAVIGNKEKSHFMILSNSGP